MYSHLLPAQSSARTQSRSPDDRDAAAIVQGLRRIVKALQLYSQEVYRSYHLTAPQLWVLKTLHRQGPMPDGRLAQALVLHQSSVSVLLRRLVRRGLVRRKRAPGDRRIVTAELTPRGAALAAEAPEPAQGRLLHSLGAMPHTEVRKIRKAVDRLVEAMEASGVEARFFFAEE
jgi:DNA-binding MarR family transcriptional regulator